jgi:hypothetical protein
LVLYFLVSIFVIFSLAILRNQIILLSYRL